MALEKRVWRGGREGEGGIRRGRNKKEREEREERGETGARLDGQVDAGDGGCCSRGCFGVRAAFVARGWGGGEGGRRAF
jgi:hypothetical protein